MIRVKSDSNKSRSAVSKALASLLKVPYSASAASINALSDIWTVDSVKPRTYAWSNLKVSTTSCVSSKSQKPMVTAESEIDCPSLMELAQKANVRPKLLITKTSNKIDTMNFL